jgi:predicted oxidoreductase
MEDRKLSKPIDDALNTTSEHSYVQKFNKHKDVPEKKDHGVEVDKDYEYSRAQLYSLIEKGQETLNGIMDVADSSGSPRAYEVAGQVLKSTADIADKLMDLQKKVKEIDETKNRTTNNVTNNAIFTGSTAELQKMIKQGFLDAK